MQGSAFTRELGELAGAICENKIVNMGFGRLNVGVGLCMDIWRAIVRCIWENKIVYLVSIGTSRDRPFYMGTGRAVKRIC
jgi:hypothetical protein